MENGFEFKYNKWLNRVTLPKMGIAFFIPIGFVVVLGFIIQLFSSKRLISDEDIFSMIVLLVTTLWVFENASISLNAYPKLKITDGGLSLRMFFFRSKWIFIPWREIIAISMSSKTYQHYGLWEISITNDIPKWQNYLMISFDVETGPTIYISSDLERKTAFLDLLSKHIDCEGLYE